jgi:hypothetical protein
VGVNVGATITVWVAGAVAVAFALFELEPCPHAEKISDVRIRRLIEASSFLKVMIFLPEKIVYPLRVHWVSKFDTFLPNRQKSDDWAVSKCSNGYILALNSFFSSFLFSVSA